MEQDVYLLAAEQLRAENAGRATRYPAAFAAWAAALPAYAARARNDGVNIDYFQGMATEALALFEDFEAATESAFASDEKRPLWTHQKISEFDRLDPRADIDVRKVKEIAERYATRPFVENEYFGWCLIDSLIGTEIKAFTRAMLSTRFGSAPGDPAFFLARGDQAKYRVLRPILDVVGFVVNYATPAAIGYWAVENGHEIIGGLFYAVSAMGLFAFAATFNRRKAVRARNAAMLEKTTEIYALLKDETLPVIALRAQIDEARAWRAVRPDRRRPHGGVDGRRDRPPRACRPGGDLRRLTRGGYSFSDASKFTSIRAPFGSVKNTCQTPSTPAPAGRRRRSKERSCVFSRSSKAARPVARKAT